MQKKTVAIIVGSAIVAVIGILVVVSLLQESPTKNTNTPALNPSTQIQEADKIQIKSHITDFVKEVGTYGWFANIISDPANANKPESFFADQSYVTADDVRGALVTLTNSRVYDSQVNDGLYGTPFSVATILKGDVTVPSSPVAEGGETYVLVKVPVESTLIYVSHGINHMDDSGVFVDGVTNIQYRVFDGEISFKFIRSGSDWVISSFKDTVGVLPTEPAENFAFPNGDLITAVKPVKSETIEVK